MIPRLFAATGAAILWAYARACRERTATQRRLARANLLRTVTARPPRCHDCGREDGGCDRVVTVNITPGEAERLSAIHNRQLLDDLEEMVEALPIAGEHGPEAQIFDHPFRVWTAAETASEFDK